MINHLDYKIHTHTKKELYLSFLQKKLLTSGKVVCIDIVQKWPSWSYLRI